MERWTLDERKDFHLIKKIIETLSKIKEDFKMLDILDILNANPDWRGLNSDVQETPRLVRDTIFKGAGSE
jgi:spore coat polysaccharide biosynthesis protein SpsF (cytidylyltransferase family)